MKPAAFHYERPHDVAEVLDLLAEHGDEAKILAGGQSLVPMMNFRLARPEVIIDIGVVPGLDHLVTHEEYVAIGTRVRHIELEQPATDGPLGSILADAARHVGHLPIRLRGTFGGSIAHADPAAEWCLLAQTLNADVVVASTRGERMIAAADLFQSAFVTSIADDELLTQVRLPCLDSDWKTGFSEFSRRAGDFAVVAVASAVRLVDGRIAEARIGAAGVGAIPVRLSQTEMMLVGHPLGPETIDAASEVAGGEVDPRGDIHGSADYRRDLVRALTRRALS
ncbi:MAG: xanthine dehydrogenase family protein subunit M [bacterium]|nr:xanthine dehydrogenase family protein subunit M [bacterium]MYH72316.1 xanthine dehydrogenase family protein subunit M [Acidimicrobiia bacterium]